jgi:uncharacterized membrane protein YoaK (UPF0700 family)
MFKSNAFKDILKNDNKKLWLLLAFQSGFINAGGFIACHRFVTHVTGFGSNIGLSFANNKIWIAMEMALAPVSFILGAAFSAFLIDRNTYQQREGQVKASVLIQSAFLIGVFVFGELGLFGVFGEPLVLQRDFALLFSLCFISGMQNGTFASLTNGMIRTTHLTGLATDLGLNVVRIPYLKVDDRERTYQRRVNRLRLNTILSFSGGSFVAAIIFKKLGYHGFIVPALTSLVVLYLCNKIMDSYQTIHSS